MSGVIIVGAGQAGAVCARTLRRQGYAEPVTLIGAEPGLPYQRPPLSKEYLADPEGNIELVTDEWLTKNEVRYLPGTRVDALDTDAGRVRLADGQELSGEHVVLATGCGARQLPGVTGERIHYLRTREDSDRLRERLTPGARLVIVGAGFIGAEVSSAALDAGASVTVLERGATPLVAAIGEELGAWCGDLQRTAGVDLRLGANVESIVETADGVQVSADGETIEADLVVVAIGTTINDELARTAGLDVDGGVLVNEACRSSLPNIFAIGDVAKHLHPLYGEHIRVEHYDTANHLASVAAKQIAGKKATISSAPWFWSDQFNRNLQWSGLRTGGEELVYRGDRDSEQWSAFFVDGDVIRAAFGCDAGEDIALAKELIALGLPVDRAVLTDPETDLMTLLEDFA